MERSEHCTEGYRKEKKLHSEDKMFAHNRDLLSVSNRLITNAKNFSLKAETRGRNKKTVEL